MYMRIGQESSILLLPLAEFLHGHAKVYIIMRISPEA